MKYNCSRLEWYRSEGFEIMEERQTQNGGPAGRRLTEQRVLELRRHPERESK
jgi:hypothetical protein